MPKSYIKNGIYRYKVNRPLSAEERYDHLPQKKPSRSKPWYAKTVIRMNSTFLECVDRVYAWRGGGTAIAIPGLFIPLSGMYMSLSIIFDYPSFTPEEKEGALLAGIAVFLMCSAFLALLIWGLRLECFRHTHYPTRFNRKTRMVHVFRPNGTVLSVPWDNIFFTLGAQSMGLWEVLGHILSEDGKTVLDTFPLSTRDDRDDSDPRTTLYQHWEFVRRYMEEGPEKLAGQVAKVWPIDERKEDFFDGLERIFANFPTFIWIIAFPVAPSFFCAAIGRWIAMRTCKIPRWPAEVEAESEFDPDDPYIRDRYSLADRYEAEAIEKDLRA